MRSTRHLLAIVVPFSFAFVVVACGFENPAPLPGPNTTPGTLPSGGSDGATGTLPDGGAIPTGDADGAGVDSTSPFVDSGAADGEGVGTIEIGGSE